jgi:hypothetical protein
MMRVKLADSSAAPVERTAVGSGHERAAGAVKSRGAAGIAVSFLERLCINCVNSPPPESGSFPAGATCGALPDGALSKAGGWADDSRLLSSARKS